MVHSDASPQGGLYPDNNASANTPSRAPAGQTPPLARYFPLKIKPDLVVQPDPLTLYFGFFGTWNWRRNVAQALTERVENTWVRINRNPTQDEMDAFTTHTSRGIYYRRMGMSLSGLLGTAYLVKITPSLPRSTPEQFKSWMRTMDGPVAMRAVFKAAFKIMFVTTTGVIVSSMVAAYTETKGALTDPRLEQFIEDMRTQKPEEIRKRKMQAAAERVRRIRAGEKDISAGIKEDLSWGGGYDQVANQDQYGYDNSASTDSPSESDAWGTSQSEQQNQPSGPNTSQMYGSSNAPQGMGNEPASPSASGSDFFFGRSDDDASPTAPEYRHTNADGSPAGSAWDRLRRQTGRSGSQQPPARPPRMQQWGRTQGAPESSGYSPAGDQDRYDTDRRREKVQAQAEFDKMMEAERNVSNDAPSRSRGWGS